MASRRALLLAALAAAAAQRGRAGKAMKTTWMDYSYVTSAFNLCNTATDTCRTLGHWVFTVAPEHVLDSVVTGAAFKLDDGPYVPAGRGNFEAHFVNGQCSDPKNASSCVLYGDERRAQVWNVGYDVIEHAANVHLPGRICAKVWMAVPATGEQGETEELCAEVETWVLHIPGNSTATLTAPDMMYSQSADAVTRLCEGDRCRLNAHISLDVEVPDPTHELLGLTEYSLDGASWTSSRTNTFFEQKVKHQGGKWYHTISWNYDDIVAKDAAASLKEVCFRMAVQNLVNLETWQVDFADGGAKEDRTRRCLRFCDSLAPFSHAVAAGGYCPGAIAEAVVQ